MQAFAIFASCLLGNGPAAAYQIKVPTLVPTIIPGRFPNDKHVDHDDYYNDSVYASVSMSQRSSISQREDSDATAYPSVKAGLPIAPQNGSKAVICYGVFYGDRILPERMRVFVEYHHSIGFDRVVAHAHPRLDDETRTALKLIPGLAIGEWPIDYEYDPARSNSTKVNHRANHQAFLGQCILEAREANYTWVLISDPDEFLVLSPSDTSIHRILQKPTKHGVGSIRFKRIEYDIDVCVTKSLTHGLGGLCDMKFESHLSLKPKSMSRIKDIAASTIHKTIKGVWKKNVNGTWVQKNEASLFDDFDLVHRMPLISENNIDVEDAHIKHFRGWLTAIDVCKMRSDKKIEVHNTSADTIDPAKKDKTRSKRNSHQGRYELDTEFRRWQQCGR